MKFIALRLCSLRKEDLSHRLPDGREHHCVPSLFEQTNCIDAQFTAILQSNLFHALTTPGIIKRQDCVSRQRAGLRIGKDGEKL